MLKVISDEDLQTIIHVSEHDGGKVQLMFTNEDKDLQYRIQALVEDIIDLGNVLNDQKKITSVLEDQKVSAPDVYCAHVPKEHIIILFGEDRNKLDNVKRKIQLQLGLIKMGSRGNRHFTTNSKTMELEQKDELMTVTKNTIMSKTVTGRMEPLVRGKLIDVMVYKGNITQLSVDVIVNAANGRLAHGAGVARAIADVAGEELLKEGNKYIKDHGVIKVSGVVATTAGRLPCKKVLHAVGPAMYDYKDKMDLCLEDLCKTILRCLCEAKKLNMTSIAIPPISSGKQIIQIIHHNYLLLKLKDIISLIYMTLNLQILIINENCIHLR